MEINETENFAMLQCFWQLLGGIKITPNDKAFVTQLVSDWKLSKDWTVHAVIGQNPINAFSTVADMDHEKKKQFKEMVVKIVESGGDYDLKTQMAASLFDKTDIPYMVTARGISLFGDEDENKGSYKIL